MKANFNSNNLKISQIDFFLIFVCTLIFGCCVNKTTTTQNQVSLPYFNERKQMVERQIKARGITEEKILEAFLRVERHRFVPEILVNNAYEDRPLPIGEGQTISQPYIVAIMTKVLNLLKHEKVLEIGTGSGYQAAILGEICDSVFTIEIIESLGKKAQKLLIELGYSNIKSKIGDGYQGWEEYAPFDAIIVTCAPTHVPEPLKAQLKEGGRMIIPVGEIWDQKLVLMRKKNSKLIEENVLSVRFVPMVNPEGKTY